MAQNRSLLDQRNLIYDESWDVLCILDACRYDTFKELYETYLRGELKRISSRGSSTPDFLSETFSEPLSDVVYVSANPFAASGSQSPTGFDPTRFHKVINVWDWGTTPELGAVHPETMTEAVLKAYEKYSDFRIIAHYIQPHIPFLTRGKIHQTENYVLRVPNPSTSVERLRTTIDNQIKFRLGKGPIWAVKRALGFPPADDMEIILADDGIEGLQHAYRANLHTALGHLHQIIREIEGKIVVTADHGELLGEDLQYGHKPGSNHPVLREVPWLRVDSEESYDIKFESPTDRFDILPSSPDIEVSNNQSEEDISQRLKDLGYI